MFFFCDAVCKLRVPALLVRELIDVVLVNWRCNGPAAPEMQRRDSVWQLWPYHRRDWAILSFVHVELVVFEQLQGVATCGHHVPEWASFICKDWVEQSRKKQRTKDEIWWEEMIIRSSFLSCAPAWLHCSWSSCCLAKNLLVSLLQRIFGKRD